MKRLLLLAAVLGLFASTTLAQAPRKVLMEEFTNTGCPPCATTDPIMDAFETIYGDRLVVLKYHVSWPDANDPFYKDQKALNEANVRGQTYYGVTGVPSVRMGGAYDLFPSSIPALRSAYESALEIPAPFTIAVTQTIEGDSIIANVTVTRTGDILATDLRLGVVFAERFSDFKGSNNAPHHTNIVRRIAGGVDKPEGSIAGPDLALELNTPTSFRYAFKIGSTWNREELMTVAFVQSASSKEVFQAEWTVPALSVSLPSANFVNIVGQGEKTLTYTIKNPSNEPLTITPTLSKVTGWPTKWTVALSGMTGTSVSVPANGTATFDAKVTTPDGYDFGSHRIVLADQEGNWLGELTDVNFGAANQHVVVDQGAGASGTRLVTTAVTAAGARATYVDGTTFGMLSDLSGLKTIIYNGGATQVGMYTGGSDWELIPAWVAAGGNFALTSSVAAGVYSGVTGYNDKFSELFHVALEGSYAQTPWTDLIGATGDVVGNGILSNVSSVSYNSPISPADEFASIMFRNESEEVVGIRAQAPGAGKTALLNFGLNNVITADRAEVTKRLIDWFMGVAAVKTSDNATSTELSNYPNPFNPSTTIEFSITEAAPVTLVVKDMMGREVARPIDFQMHQRGTYSQPFDASDLASGTYIYELTAGSQKITKKMTLNK
jgi:hypothetical protein